MTVLPELTLESCGVHGESAMRDCALVGTWEDAHVLKLSFGLEFAVNLLPQGLFSSVLLAVPSTVLLLCGSAVGWGLFRCYSKIGSAALLVAEDSELKDEDDIRRVVGEVGGCDTDCDEILLFSSSAISMLSILSSEESSRFCTLSSLFYS
jgi:hypothetical protein